jgi:DNA-binding NarL/FixJ family response regulator
VPPPSTPAYPALAWELADLFGLSKAELAVTVDRFGLLTPRQQEIAALYGQGHQGRQVGRLLGMAYSTLCTHRSLVYRTLQVGTAGGIVRAWALWAAAQPSLWACLKARLPAAAPPRLTQHAARKAARQAASAG